MTERLLVVSNRLPVSVTKEEAGWKVSRSAGGLATAMDPLLRQNGGIWIGWTGGEDESDEVLEILSHDHGCIGVSLPEDVAAGFYEGYSNQALWPLFHSFTTRLSFDPAAWAAYSEANRLFCDAVVERYEPGDRIWVHDYHLMLLPSLLRARLPDAAIGFFLHIPFPASDIFALLPRGDELLQGLLGADLVAFHTHVHLQHFRRAVRRLLGLESRFDRVEAGGGRVWLQALPIGIGPEDFTGLLDDPQTVEHAANLRQTYAGLRLIVAVDRLDYTKGLPERLRTFRRLLQQHPELREKVVLLQVAVPSRENIGSYQELTSEVHQLIGEVNGTFGTAHWTPVVYIHRGISRHELVALYQSADVAWVGSLRDGMNLVAKEFVACKPDGNGVLVLSSFAGAAAEMGEALLINPYDEERTAEAIARALSMPADEQKDRMRALHERVARNDVFAWGDRFLSALADAVDARKQMRDELPMPLDQEELVTAYKQARHRILFLDYDGTLVGFAPRPQDARPDSRVLAALTQLAADPASTVVLISGRRSSDLERWLGEIPGLILAAEHGARWRRSPKDGWEGEASTGDWKTRVRPILEHFTDRVPGSCIEEKEVALVWHYRNAEAEFGEWIATELLAMLDGMLAETELQAYRGDKIVEIKPPNANKGAFAAAMLDADPNADLILALGDDRTDEDLFVRVPGEAWTIHVGEGASKARFRITDVKSVRGLLDRLIEQSPRPS